MDQLTVVLISGLGGAAITAAAAVAVPLITGRHARHHEQRARTVDEFDRMMDLRVATRDLLLLLDDARKAARNDRPVDLSELPNAIKQVRTAADRCEVYGLNFVHSPSSRDFGRDTPEARGLHSCIQSAQSVGHLVDEAAQAHEPPDRQLWRRINETFHQAEQARRQVLGVLMDRMAELRAEMART
ncbi:hypothetical protein ACFYXC_38905 [Streptomyces sp. NPDC002701]|uniref:hypothetical protein n=1 Tax=Streptomyces sp. NPDC002701 TaxID=3364661 RepID=UPI0036916105